MFVLEDSRCAILIVNYGAATWKVCRIDWYQLGICKSRVKLYSSLLALFGLVNNRVTCALVQSGVCDVDDLLNSCRAWTFEQSTVASIWRGLRGIWQEVWLKISAVVVPVLGVNLHGLDVECVWRVN